MELTAFKARVRKVLDMDNIPELIMADDTDAATLDAIIEGNAVPAAREIVSLAPVRTLAPYKKNSSGLTKEFVQSNGLYVVKSTLPDDFFRPVCIKMKSWERPAKIITDDSVEYALQSSKWAGLRGNPEAPVAVLVKSSGSCGYRLELYSSKSNTDGLEDFAYVPLPAVSGTELNIPARVEDAVVYACASLTADTFGNASLAERFMSHAYRLAEITTNNTTDDGNKE